MLAPPIAATSCATAMLDTVARPTWLSGTRNDRATGASTPIWCRTCRRSGRVGGSIGHAGALEATRQAPQPRRRVLGGEPLEFHAARIHNRDRMLLAGPVDSPA